MLTELEILSFEESDNIDVFNTILKISVKEKLDQSTMKTFEAIMLTLIKGGIRKVILNLKDLKYIDSSGIGKIINITKIIRKAGGDLTITQCNEKIYNILKLVKLDTFLKFFLTNEEGANYLRFL